MLTVRARIRRSSAVRAVLDVPEVELDPLGPRQRRAAVDLRPAGDPRLDREPAALALGVLLHLHRHGRPRPDDRHLAAQHVPQVRQLVERVAAQQLPDPRDPVVALLDREPGAGELGPADHRAQLVDLERLPVPAHARLACRSGGPATRAGSAPRAARRAARASTVPTSDTPRSSVRLIIACPQPAPTRRTCRARASPTARRRARRS